MEKEERIAQLVEYIENFNMPPRKLTFASRVLAMLIFVVSAGLYFKLSGYSQFSEMLNQPVAPPNFFGWVFVVIYVSLMAFVGVIDSNLPERQSAMSINSFSGLEVYWLLGKWPALIYLVCGFFHPNQLAKIIFMFVFGFSVVVIMLGAYLAQVIYRRIFRKLEHIFGSEILNVWTTDDEYEIKHY